MQVHEVDEEKPRHGWEYVLGWVAKNYAKHRVNKAPTESVRHLWEHAMRDQVIYGRQLVVSAQVKSSS